jgi:HEAT repeat protein
LRRIVLATLPILVLSGCGKGQPTLAGGKPVSYWVQALHDPDARVRKKAVFKLGNAGAADASVLPALLRALKDVDAAVRCEAILALLKLGPPAREALPILGELERSDRDARVRACATRALEKLRREM